MNRFRSLLLTVVFGLAGSVAHAQWQWTDKDGRNVFSDRAPSADVPAKNIIKRPGAGTRGVDTAVSTLPVNSASASGAGGNETRSNADIPKLRGIDKELTDKKKLAADLIAARAKADEERADKSRNDNCARARSNKGVLESGVRVSQADANGERSVMDDVARAAELRRIQTAINANCK